MTWRTEPLRRVAPPEASTRRFAPDAEVWHLNLDQIESQTGRILERKLAPADKAGSSTFVFDEGNVLYSKLRPYLNKVVRPSESGIATTELVPLRPRRDVVDPHFLTYFLRSVEFVTFASNCVAGVKMPRVLMDKLWAHPVPLPPPSEQRRIVELLDQADALRRKRADADAKVGRILPALFLKMFGDPATNPKGWPTVRLGKHARIRRGASPRPIDAFMGGQVPWIKIGDASGPGSLYIEKTASFVTDEGAERSVRVAPGALLVANSGVSCGFARISRIGGCIHDGWLSIEDISQQLDTLFLLHLINLQTLTLRAKAPAGTQPNLNTGIMNSFMVPLPPGQLLKAFKHAEAAWMMAEARKLIGREKINKLFATMQTWAYSGNLTARWREAHLKELFQEMEQQAQYLAASATEATA